MRTLITQGKASFDGSFYFECPVKLTFKDNEVNAEYENILDTGERFWQKSNFIHVPLTYKAANELALKTKGNRQ